MISVIVFFAMTTMDKILDPCGSVKFELVRQQQKKPVYRIPKGEIATDIKPPHKDKDS